MNFINKIKFFSKYVAVASILGLYSCDTSETQTVTTLTNVVWADEFDGSGAPSTSNWVYDIGNGGNTRAGSGWGNNELQSYTDRTENIGVENGNLYITARQESFMGSNYTSSRILTKGLFESKYGRYEARIKLPWGQGIWPAFWLLGNDSNGAVSWPQIGEIDIMEFRGQEPTKVDGTIHGPGYSAAEGITKSYELENDRFDNGFHIFGIEWGPNYINFYVDDVLYNQMTPADLPEGAEWVFNDNQFHIILNVAVGGNFVGPPNSSTVFPQTMLVDYVRVYQ